MRSEDIIRVRHMLDAARKALVFVTNKKRADIDHDQLLVFGLMKAVEIVGEAAS